MYEYIYRICWACWIFGIILATLCFFIAFNEKQFVYVGFFFVAIHIIGLIGTIKKGKPII